MSKVFVIIGRFQPMHNAHKFLIDKTVESMDKKDRLHVFIGSPNTPRQFKNPYTFEERKNVLEKVISRHHKSTNFSVSDLKDFPYMDDMWEDNLHDTLHKLYPRTKDFVICSSGKEGDGELRTSWARDFDSLIIETPHELSATVVRDMIRNGECVKDLVPEESFEMISSKPEISKFLKETYDAAKNYIDSFSGPFPTQFASTDVIVRDVEGRYLAITRGEGNGYNQIAWPGGHLEIDLNSWDNSKKELLEETNLNLDLVTHNVITSWNCTEPGRSLLRRMTTEIFLVEIDESFDDLGIKPPEDKETLACHFLEEEEVHEQLWFSDHYGLFLKLLENEENLLKLTEGKRCL